MQHIYKLTLEKPVPSQDKPTAIKFPHIFQRLDDAMKHAEEHSQNYAGENWDFWRAAYYIIHVLRIADDKGQAIEPKTSKLWRSDLKIGQDDGHEPLSWFNTMTGTLDVHAMTPGQSKRITEG